MSKLARSPIVGIFVFCVFLLSACYASASTPSPRKTTKNIDVTVCSGFRLNITVRQGPSLNSVLDGKIALDSDYFRPDFAGDFVKADGSSDSVSLSFQDRAVQFILDTPKGRIFGAGVMEDNPRDCSGAGGGTFSGPVYGDLGDWRAKWVSETHTETITDEPELPRDDSPSFLPLLFMLLALIIVLIVFATILKLFKPFKHTARNTTLRKADPKVNTEANPGEIFITEYLVAYTPNDKFFDLSFELEKDSKYFGDCGINIAKTLDQAKKEVTALEVWLFDKDTSQTVSQMLLSDYCYNEASLRSEMEMKGHVAPIHIGATLILETQTLKAVIKIMTLEYEDASTHSKSVFKRIVVKIRVFKKNLSHL